MYFIPKQDNAASLAPLEAPVLLPTVALSSLGVVEMAVAWCEHNLLLGVGVKNVSALHSYTIDF
jgi:hypothetical protein